MRHSSEKASTIWFTGLSGSGKSTLSGRLASYLQQLAIAHQVLDGDEVRRDLCRDLGFSKQDRDENVRRIGYVARLLNRHGVVAVVSAIAPYRAARLEVRRQCNRFVEVHVDCAIPELVRRDQKDLYRRALSGQLDHFTGISDPYEAPLDPEVYLNTEHQSIEESFGILLSRLRDLGVLPLERPAAIKTGAKSLPKKVLNSPAESVSRGPLASFNR